MRRFLAVLLVLVVSVPSFGQVLQKIPSSRIADPFLHNKVDVIQIFRLRGTYSSLPDPSGFATYDMIRLTDGSVYFKNASGSWERTWYGSSYSGDVSSALINDVSGVFTDDRLLQVLYTLYGYATAQASSVTVQATKTVFTASTTIWRHYWNGSKRLVREWPFTIMVGGVPFQNEGTDFWVIPGPKPGLEAGLEVHVSNGEYWPSGVVVRAIFALEDAVGVDVPDEVGSLLVETQRGVFENPLGGSLMQP
ncbi:MAG: hypothetical protein DRZ76_03305 [Candidatus Nealsonbacteria bacterium]|nr:MAG: hypothetical protein DRZ76_03305 [Candidatus Nealsonbacteria bacterium]